MDFRRINHVGIFVSDMARATRFYETVLGLGEADAFPDRSFVALTWGRELHDVALIQSGAGFGGAPGGVHHVAITLDGGTKELRAFAARAVANGATIEGAVDHLVSRSLYLLDPDGNRIEVYIDMPRDTWEHVPHAMLHGDPLDLIGDFRQLRA